MYCLLNHNRGTIVLLKPLQQNNFSNTTRAFPPRIILFPSSPKWYHVIIVSCSSAENALFAACIMLTLCSSFLASQGELFSMKLRSTCTNSPPETINTAKHVHKMMLYLHRLAGSMDEKSFFASKWKWECVLFLNLKQNSTSRY